MMTTSELPTSHTGGALVCEEQTDVTRGVHLQRAPQLPGDVGGVEALVLMRDVQKKNRHSAES